MAARNSNRVFKATPKTRKRAFQALSPIANAIVEMMKRRRRIDALARGRLETATRKKRRSLVRTETLHECARRLSIAGISLKEMAPHLAKFAGLSPGRTRKVLYGAPIVPEHLRNYRDVSIALYRGDWNEVRRISQLLSVKHSNYIGEMVHTLKPLSDTTREQVVLAVCFGLRT